jgi:spermidine synthase
MLLSFGYNARPQIDRTIMKPTIKLESVTTPDGSELTLSQHDGDFIITIDGQVLMTSRQHESELELARLGCARLTGFKDPVVLIGGLGMGYTLRQTLDIVGKHARVVVAELRPEIVRWNREHFAELTKSPLDDRRVVLKNVDVFDLIRKSKKDYDAILLDLDNGPDAMSADRNDHLYSKVGLRTCMAALQPRACLGVWSAQGDTRFEHRMQAEKLQYRRFRVPAHKGGRARALTIWIASTDEHSLPNLPTRDRDRPTK